jgi:hypothetical protein
MRAHDGLVSLIILVLSSVTWAAQQVKILHDFEDPSELRAWEFQKKSAALSDQHASHGKGSLKIAGEEYMVSWRLPKDWSAYDSLDMDIFVEGDGPVGGSLLIGDVPWQQKNGTYWNRHNGSFNLKPGANTLSIPVHGLYRGEAGSRNNDIKSNIDPAQIIRFDLGFKSKVGAALYLDHMRLVKETRPEGIFAFDFGPESQVLFPGFTPISWNTVHGKDNAAAGLRYAQPRGFSRDDTFPTRLYQDCIGLDDNEFIVDLPNGGYRVWVVYNDLGYWGGETCKHRQRSIEAEGKTVWSEDRGQAGNADYLWHFETVEPRPGQSLWDLYMSYLFAPKRFAVEVKDGQLNLRFKADGGNACRVAAIIIYPDSRQAEAAPWVAEIEQRNRAEFESRAVYMGPQPKPLDIPADAAQKGYWVGFPSLEENVTLCDAPGKSDGKLRRAAAQGQRVSLTFAIRPLKDLAQVSLAVTDLKGATASIPAGQIDLRYVHHLTQRGFNNIAYTIAPESLRRVEGSNLRLEKDLTRQFWLTVHVPDATPPGTYGGQITLAAGTTTIQLPLTLEVVGVKLDEPPFAMGFYGLNVPGEISQRQGPAALRELLQTINDAGMNTFSGGPNIRFMGFDPAGKPRLDFAACDEFFRIVNQVGFKEATSYGGPGMVTGLHDGYVVGQTGRDWEQKTGKPFGEILRIVWSAVEEHARKENWPPILYGFTDEPRVLEQAQAEVELMKLYRQHAPWVNIGGSYSVQWNNDPLEKAIQDIFTTLKWSALNTHAQIHLDKAKELNKTLYIYNQDTTRYSFGAYQWAEMRKGVQGRLQWHLLALHGYQFFDLDGREPDTAMIHWGQNEILPTLNLHRCREGADDFRFAMTLWNLAEKHKDHPAAAEAKAWLERINQQIPIAQRTRPVGFMEDEAFRNGCVERIRKLLE